MIPARQLVKEMQESTNCSEEQAKFKACVLVLCKMRAAMSHVSLMDIQKELQENGWLEKEYEELDAIWANA